MNIWLIRKHPPMPYRGMPGHLAAFTIKGVCYSHAEAANRIKDLMSRATTYLYTFQKLNIGETK